MMSHHPTLFGQIQAILVRAAGRRIGSAPLEQDARRLLGRCLRLARMNLIDDPIDADAMQLTCYALQIPLIGAPAGRANRMNPRERAAASAARLASLPPAPDEEALAARAIELLEQLQLRHPARGAARLLADAINLDDFGLTGLLMQSLWIARQGGGVEQIAEGCEKREQYGYWEARLNEGFHFPPAREIARRRLESLRGAAALLREELREDAIA